MYALVDETSAWANATQQNKGVLQYPPRGRALVCLCVDTKLQGVSYVESLPNWKHVGGFTYMVPLPRVDILEAVYMQDHDKYKPRIKVLPSLDGAEPAKVPVDETTKIVSLPTDGILNIPDIALQFSTLTLEVDAFELQEGAFSLPDATVRCACLQSELRQKTAKSFHKYHDMFIWGGLLQNLEAPE